MEGLGGPGPPYVGGAETLQRKAGLLSPEGPGSAGNKAALAPSAHRSLPAPLAR